MQKFLHETNQNYIKNLIDEEYVTHAKKMNSIKSVLPETQKLLKKTIDMMNLSR